MQSGPKRLVYVATTLIVILGVSAFPRIAFASPEATGVGVTPPGILTLVTAVGDDAFSTIDLTALAAVLDPASSTQHYGPYATSSPDSGTCGNDWATDMFNRHFTVFFNKDGTVSSIVEQFKDGSFSTTSGPSPGACETTPPVGTVNGGITGDLHGYFIISVAPGTTETRSDSHCNAVTMTTDPTTCDTLTFIDTHFSCSYGTTCNVPTFFFHYSAGDQGLIMHEWKNASDDRGGNHGDIRSANV